MAEGVGDGPPTTMPKPWKQTDESSEHTKGKRPSTREKHEKGDQRRMTDRGGERRTRTCRIEGNVDDEVATGRREAPYSGL